MKRLTLILLTILVFTQLISAQKKDIVKTGLNLGPLPVLAYDADKGFQFGAILQLFDYGDGSSYPNYDAKTFLEYSHYTKGSNLIQLRHDNKVLIPGVRWSSSLRINLDRAYDFYGFGGYQSYYNHIAVTAGKQGESFLFSPFYRYQNNQYLMRSDFIGTISGKIQWEAGIFVNYFDIKSIDYGNINKGKSLTEQYPEGGLTLFDIYKKSGLISEKEANGGLSSGLRAGVVYDTRDKEGAPTRGIWAEAHISAAIPGISESPFCRYSLTWRHYLPVVKNDVLTFAYRLNYEGNFGNSAPFYALPFMTVMGEKNDLEGMGGYFTTRGIMRARVVGLDMAAYNAEFRWRFVKFNLWNQNIALGLSVFSDGAMAARTQDLTALKNYLPTIDPSESEKLRVDLQNTVLSGRTSDTFHITLGAGFRFIMNENFIVAAEYGTPVSNFNKQSPLYRQDGTGAFYVNIGYLF